MAPRLHSECGMQNTNQPADDRRQTPEETMQRIAGVPKTPEELEAERHQLEADRLANQQRAAGVMPEQPTGPIVNQSHQSGGRVSNQAPVEHNDKAATHNESEREQRERQREKS